MNGKDNYTSKKRSYILTLLPWKRLKGKQYTTIQNILLACFRDLYTFQVGLDPQLINMSFCLGYSTLRGHSELQKYPTT